jgi:hypothetical protein
MKETWISRRVFMKTSQVENWKKFGLRVWGNGASHQAEEVGGKTASGFNRLPEPVIVLNLNRMEKRSKAGNAKNIPPRAGQGGCPKGHQGREGPAFCEHPWDEICACRYAGSIVKCVANAGERLPGFCRCHWPRRHLGQS